MGHGVVVSGDGLVQIGLQILDLSLQHDVMGLAVLLLQLVQPSLLPLVLLTHRFQGILDAEELSLLLL